MIKGIIFDFYGVFEPDTYDTWLSEQGLQRDDQYNDIANRLDLGQISSNTFHRTLSSLSEVPLKDIELYFAKQHALPEDFRQLLERLKGNGVKLAILSNGFSNVRTKLEQNNVLDLFDNIVISAEVGLAKPGHEIFELASAELGLPNGKILFVDDRLKNTQVAKQIGLLTHVFESTDKLVNYLDEFKLI